VHLVELCLDVEFCLESLTVYPWGLNIWGFLVADHDKESYNQGYRKPKLVHFSFHLSSASTQDCSTSWTL